ncbi:uncharacterized protein LOC127849651 [Dreissena polymorpha]|nr:uncharacterized protein LOC127849651 [Dreissena polymorpha]
MAEVDFNIQRLNSQALLAHWRVLVGLLKHLQRDRQVQFLNLDNQSTSTPPVMAGNVPPRSEPAHAGPNIQNMSVQEYLLATGQTNFSLARGNRDTSQELVQPVASKIPAFDSHFHLHRSLGKLGIPHNSDVQTVLDVDVGTRPQVEVDVVGGVIIYCHPETYPTSFPVQAELSVPVGYIPGE